MPLKLFPLYFVIFIGFVGYSMMITLFTPLIMEDGGGLISATASMESRTITLGLLLALYPLGQFFGSPILGSLSDHYGRKVTLILSLVMACLFYGWIARSLMFADLRALMFGCFLAGICEGNIVIAMGAISDSASAEERNPLFGMIYLFTSLAFVVGPLFSGQIASKYGSYAASFWGMFALIFINFMLILLFFKETLKRAVTGPICWTKSFMSIAGLFKEKELRVSYLTNFLLYLAIFGFFRSYPMYLVGKFGMDVGQVSKMIAWVAVPIIFANAFLIRPLSNRFTARQLTIASAILTGILMMGVIIPQPEKVLWITLFLPSLALAITLPSCATFLSHRSGQERLGIVMGGNQSLQVLAEALSGALAGFMAAQFLFLPLLVLGCFALLGASLLFFTKEYPA